jgi:hypothetical protein
MYLFQQLIYLCNGYYNIQKHCEIFFLMMTLLKFKSAPLGKKNDDTQKGSPIFTFVVYLLSKN